MPGGSCTSICRVERSEGLAPVLFCSSELTDTFIGATPPCATMALTADGATGSIEYSGASSALRAKLESTPNSFIAAGAAAANHFSNWPSRSLRASPSPRAIEAARAMRRQLLVDHARHGLIGRRPVAVAAAEHGVAHLGERILRQVAAQPFDELRGVVRGCAIVGGAEDQQRRPAPAACRRNRRAAPSLVAKPLTSARSATRVASSSAVPRLEP